jgi:type VI secretion system protein ImpA
MFMASPNILDLDALLQPISEDSPAGSDLRQDSSPTSLYQTIKAERAAARGAERKSVHDGDTTEADDHWRKVLSLGPDILSSQSKDLEVASWLTEALIRRHGFQGLRDGFVLLRGLVQDYWDDLFPMPDEDGIETRVSPISGLNGEGAEGVLIAPIRKVAITEGYEPGPFSLWQYQQALEVQRSPDEETRASRAANLGFSLEDIENSVNHSSDQYYLELSGDLEECIAAYKDLSRKLDEHCGAHDAPPTRTIIEVLEECLGAVNHIAKHKLLAPEETAPTDEETADIAASPAQGAVQAKGSGPIDSREAAFKQLLEIAGYFRKTEPHSPLSYMIEKAVKWGNMSLSELMVELIPDSSSREHYSELTGVRTED